MPKLPPPPPDSADADEQAPGVPGLRTWRGLYQFVLVVFAAVVVALAIFSRYYA
jgi:hypothetical protein